MFPFAYWYHGIGLRADILVDIFAAPRDRLNPLEPLYLLLEEADLPVEDLHLELQAAAAAQVRVPRRRPGPRRLLPHRGRLAPTYRPTAKPN